ncbi:heterokaryon incompatibility protein-domain-containing protein [Microdochium trichocladiopsis]|uniref:Heterokaryon incompatibility protein-domain-containing protein n=1 Tax=Microdochium trichocladiopsis TaxID=1682393 RepID=A0A9P8XYF1_9PEZI|nr:heterokaryon incompatibility protein-domain-containing protein [Microdochium trichocladiopsis]KAH7024375.1 heterokaryon incompatibility protein-domain-containing protein [Microdochium trichocladiopsis]
MPSIESGDGSYGQELAVVEDIVSTELHQYISHGSMQEAEHQSGHLAADPTPRVKFAHKDRRALVLELGDLCFPPWVDRFSTLQLSRLDMRLLEHHGNLGIAHTKDYDASEIPPYAILSHTWEDGQEVTFEDIRDRESRRKSKKGWRKIAFCGKRAAKDGLRHFWIDSCCIDKTNEEEHHGAINSMYEWYHKSSVCYAYLTDVTSIHDLPHSRWWTRGWTLQELLAPRCVLFFNRSGDCLGDKDSLEDLIVRRTSIPPNALRGYPFQSFDIEQRLSWIGDRQTKYPEDLYNCLRADRQSSSSAFTPSVFISGTSVPPPRGAISSCSPINANTTAMFTGYCQLRAKFRSHSG